VRRDERLRELDQADLIEFLAGTGCRIGEACALAWEAVDLEAGTVTIRANAIRARGRGVLVQDHPKTKAGVCTIALPVALVGLLGDRRIRAGESSHGLVFPTVLATSATSATPRATGATRAIALGFRT
jgi:integrase